MNIKWFSRDVITLTCTKQALLNFYKHLFAPDNHLLSSAFSLPEFACCIAMYQWQYRKFVDKTWVKTKYTTNLTQNEITLLIALAVSIATSPRVKVGWYLHF